MHWLHGHFLGQQADPMHPKSTLVLQEVSPRLAEVLVHWPQHEASNLLRSAVADS